MDISTRYMNCSPEVTEHEGSWRQFTFPPSKQDGHFIRKYILFSSSSFIFSPGISPGIKDAFNFENSSSVLSTDVYRQQKYLDTPCIFIFCTPEDLHMLACVFDI